MIEDRFVKGAADREGGTEDHRQAHREMHLARLMLRLHERHGPAFDRRWMDSWTRGVKRHFGVERLTLALVGGGETLGNGIGGASPVLRRAWSNDAVERTSGLAPRDSGGEAEGDGGGLLPNSAALSAMKDLSALDDSRIGWELSAASHVGWDNKGQTEIWERLMSAAGAGKHPLIDRLRRYGRRAAAVVSVADFEGTEFAILHRVWGVKSVLCARCPVGRRSEDLLPREVWVFGYRIGERPGFDDSDARVMKRLVSETARLLRSQHHGVAVRKAMELAPRLRQTLLALLDGYPTKRLATELELSTNTIDGYVKGVYRHFGVSSRGELLSLFINREVLRRLGRGRGMGVRRIGR